MNVYKIYYSKVYKIKDLDTLPFPALDKVDIKKYWSRDQLINYLRNPNSFMSSERFQDYKAKYSNVIMPSYTNIDVKDLGKIAEYLLELK